MMIHKGNSLDFYDVFNLIYKALDIVKLKQKYRYEIYVDPDDDVPIIKYQTNQIF